MSMRRSMQDFMRNFRKAEDGVVTLEFVIIFPIFFFFFLMTVENGLISLRHVMLERGVDVAVRDIRIGRNGMVDPTRALLKERICQEAAIIPDCDEQLAIELLPNDLRNWDPNIGPILCRDRGEDPPSGDSIIPTGGNNALMFIRVCARIDPFMPTTGLGKTIVDSNTGTAAGGSYALVSTAAFVVEPFRAVATGGGD